MKRRGLLSIIVVSIGTLTVLNSPLFAQDITIDKGGVTVTGNMAVKEKITVVPSSGNSWALAINTNNGKFRIDPANEKCYFYLDPKGHKGKGFDGWWCKKKKIIEKKPLQNPLQMLASLEGKEFVISHPDGTVSSSLSVGQKADSENTTLLELEDAEASEVSLSGSPFEAILLEVVKLQQQRLQKTQQELTTLEKRLTQIEQRMGIQ